MISELMQAMMEQAPAKAKALTRNGPEKLEQTVKGAVKRARENLAPNGLPEDDPNQTRMLEEMIFSDALAELTA